MLAMCPCFYFGSILFMGDREIPFPCDSSLDPRWAFAPQNQITSPQLSCRCSKHLEIDILQNKRAAMPQCQSQKVKASLPTSHTCPSTNVFHREASWEPSFCFLSSAQRGRGHLSSKEITTFKATLWSVVSKSGSAWWAARPCPWEQRHSHPLLQGLADRDFCSCCMHRFGSDWPRDETEPRLHAGVLLIVKGF